jgi:hypothetical protein
MKNRALRNHVELGEECEDSEIDLPCDQSGNFSELYDVYENLQDSSDRFIS